MKESVYKSIAEIMAFFDFNKVAEIEKVYNEFLDVNENDELVNVIKEFALNELFSLAEKCKDRKEDYFSETMYSLHFDYVYDEVNPHMELKYIPVSYGEI